MTKASLIGYRPGRLLGGIVFTAFLAGLILSFLLPSARLLADDNEPASYAGRIIGQVRVEGNQTVEAGKILSKVRSRQGAVLNEDILAKDTRRIISLPEIYDVRWRITPLGDKVELVFQITESPRIATVEILGNKNIKTEELAKQLELAAGSLTDIYLVRMGAQSLQEYYRKKGYFFAEVNVNESLLKDEQKVVYVVVEGPKLRIKKIYFEGNEFFGKGKLKKKIKAGAYFPIFNKGLLDTEQLEQDRMSLEKFYHDEGFLDAQVFWRKEFNEQKTRVFVHFVIEEGVRYRLGRILFEGDGPEAYSRDEMIEVIKIEPGDVLTEENRVISERNVTRLYGKKGYIYARVNVRPRFTDEDGLADMLFEIDQNDSYTLGRLIIQGNYETKDKVVRRAFDHYDFLPDSVYNSDAADRAKRRLGGRALFEDIRVTPIGQEPHSRDALIEVAETHTGLLLFGVGVDTDSGVVGQISLDERNFDIAKYPKGMSDLFTGEALTGAGQRLRLDFEPGTKVTRGRIKFHEPYLFDQPYYLDVNLFLFRRWRESYLEKRRGASIGLGRRFKNDWSTDITLRAEQINIGQLDEGFRALDPCTGAPTDWGYIAPQDAIDVKGSNYLASLRFGLGYDSTDSFFMPTEGEKLYMSWEQVGAMGGDFSFAALSASGTIFRTIYEDILERKTVVAATARGSNIIGDAPLFERYYAGGIGSLRGFDYRGVSPRGGVKQDPIGSDYIFLAGAELTHPLYEEVIFGKMFCDTGLVSTGPYRVTVGFGLQLVVPQLFQMIPMHFDFGWPVIKGEQDDTRVFSFSFGMNF